MEVEDRSVFSKSKNCIHISYSLGIFIATIFIISLFLCGFMVFKYIECYPSNKASRDSFDGVELNLEKHYTKDVRLPTSVVPHSYEIQIVPFIWEGNFTFKGRVTIVVNITQLCKNITLHANNINITSYQVYVIPKLTIDEPYGNEEAIQVIKLDTDKKRHFIIFHFSHFLKVDRQYSLHIEYDGDINSGLQGFYRSSYKVGNTTRWIAVTQFQATDARQAFPCFDEPALKARFTLRIARPANMTSLSNMPIAQFGIPFWVENITNYVMDVYKESVPMSTYLVAFAITDFHELSDKRIHLWAREEAIEQATFAMSIGPKLLTFYEQYFQVDYPLPKIDMIAIPDFASGAMENWGLITYRETAMLYKEGVSTRYNQQNVAMVLAHELAHQWFGNLVTPEWWSDLWLNEGFATYMEYLATSSIEPSWKVMEQFVVQELQGVMVLDALKSTHPISVNVSNPDEINEIFDGISYSKGASVIHMMNHFLTAPVFKQGITDYIINKSYKSATQDDLWSALTAQAHKQGTLPKNMNVKKIMDTWISQSGFPVLTVIRNYVNQSAKVTQSRFTTDPKTKETDECLWWVPITYTTEKVLNFNDTKPTNWLKGEKEILITGINATSEQWVLFNIQETGFYRVNYDEWNWQLLSMALNDPYTFETIDAVNRAQLVNDALRLAHNGLLNYSTALDVTRYLQHEIEYVPWIAAFSAFDYLDQMLHTAPNYHLFKTYLLNLAVKMYKEIGFTESVNDDQLTIYKRVELLNYACRLGLDDCLRNAINQFQSWRQTPNPDVNNPISVNLKYTVYCTAIKYGGKNEWDFAWQRYQKSNVGSEKDILIGALGCTREPWILTRYLEWALDSKSGIRKQDSAKVFVSVAGNIVGQPFAWSMVRDQWSRVSQYLGSSLFGMGSIIRSVTKGMNTIHDVNEVIDFMKKHGSETVVVNRALKESIEKAQSNVNWMERNYKTIISWLNESSINSSNSLIIA